MEYLGSLKNMELDDLSIDERNGILVSNGLFSEVYSIPIPNDGTLSPIIDSNAQRIVEPAIKLCNVFYTFVTTKYEQKITTAFLDFFYGFNNEVYGLDHSKKKAIALEYFKDYADDLTRDNVPFINLLKLKTGSDIVESQGKFEMLYDKQNMLKINLAKNEELIFIYLKGDEEYFTVKLMDDIEILGEVIDFEYKLKIAISLNEQFSFEKDSYFTKIHIENENREPPVIQKPPKRVQKQPLISNQEAIEYLIKNIFNHKTGQ